MKSGVKTSLKKLAVPVISAVLALAVGIFIIELTGNDAATAYSFMIQGAFGSFNSICEVIVVAIPLIFTGLAITFAYRSGVYTIGVDGQLIIGSICASWVVVSLKSFNGVIVVILGILAGMAAGALWGAIAGMLKAYRKVNEIVSTLLLNYIALYLANYLFSGPLSAKDSKIPQTEKIADNLKLPVIFSGTRLHAGLIAVLLCAAAVYYVLFKTAWGVKFRAVGTNANAAKCNGVNVNKYMIVSMAVSGAIAGLAGTIELMGTQFKIQEGFCADYGFDGIAVALIGQLHPLGVILSGVLFGILNVGSNSMELMTNVPSTIADIIQGIIIAFVVAGTAITESNILKLNIWKKREKSRGDGE